MIAWENLLTGFGFRFRSLLNLVASSYLLASILPFFGCGESGFSNLASVARHFRLVALGDWIENSYQSLRSGIPWWVLIIVLVVWLFLVCVSLVGEYKDGVPSNLIPNSAVATACIWCLWVDFISTGIAILFAFIFVIPTLGFIWWLEGKGTACAALGGIVGSFFYVVLAPPLWFAGSDTANHSGDFERGFWAGRSLSARNRT